MFRRLTIAALLATVTACAATDPVAVASIPPVQFDPMSSVVKVISMGGHGSGVHIGGGIVITAAHVVKPGVLAVVFENETYEMAKVLWSSPEYDVAAVRFAPEAVVTFPGANLDCRTPLDGEAITARGNPGILDFVSLRGYVAGKIRESAPEWKEVIVADISGAGGISGGPVFSEADDVVGIVVGGMLTPLVRGEDSYDLSQTGLAFVVPASTICMLLGRA